MACGKIKKKKNMLEIGEVIKLMGMVFIPLHKAIIKVMFLLYFRLIY